MNVRYEKTSSRSACFSKNARPFYKYIHINVRETGIDGANWIRLGQDRVQWRAFVNTIMNLWVP
jgi:hypothetical protein